MNAPGASIGEPDVDRWQPVEREERQEADEVAPPVADDEATPTPAATRSAPPPPAPATDTSTATAITPAGQMLIGATSVATLGGIGLYNTVGAVGLAAGGAVAVAGAGGYAYWRYRRWRNGRNGGGGNRRTSSSGGGKSTFPSATRSGRGATFTTGRTTPATRSSSGGGRGATGTPFRSGSRSGATGSAATKRHMKFPGPGSGGGGGRGGATGRNATNTKGGGGSATSRRHPATATHRYTTPARATATRAARALRRATATRVKRIRATSRHHTTRLPHAARHAARRARHLITRLQRADTRLTDTLAAVAGEWWRNRRATTTATATATTDGATDTATGTPGDTSTATTDATGTATDTSATTGDTATDTSSKAPPPATDTTPAQPPARRYPMSSSSPLVVISADMVSGIARYLPHDMWQVELDLQQLPQVPENVALSLRAYTGNLEAAYPIDPRVTEMLGQFYAGIAAQSALAQEIATAFSRIHADDIKRRLAPRRGEHLWNV